MENNEKSGVTVDYRSKEAMADFIGYLGEYSIRSAREAHNPENKAVSKLFGDILCHFRDELQEGNFSKEACQLVYRTIKKHEPERMGWLEKQCSASWKKHWEQTVLDGHKEKLVAAALDSRSKMQEKEEQESLRSMEPKGLGDDMLREFDSIVIPKDKGSRDALASFLDTGNLRDPKEIGLSKDGKGKDIEVEDVELNRPGRSRGRE